MSLRQASLSRRVFSTSVLIVLGLGYVLALIYLFTGHVRHFMSEGHSPVEAIEFTYHGLPSAQPRLLVSLQGTMASTISAHEYDQISAWIDGGATEADYATSVEPIISKNCMSCHHADGYFPTLETYEDLKPLTEPDTGMDVTKLARMTHVHLLGIPLLFYILGALFIRTRWNEVLKSFIVVLPFVGILMDIAHWWITKTDKNAAVGVLLGGALMSLGFALQWLMIFVDLWAPVRAPKSEARAS